MAGLTEAETRAEIDRQLAAAGWSVQHGRDLNLAESLGVALREDRAGAGYADYMLYVDGKVCGTLEAKREGASLAAAAGQTARYAKSDLPHAQRWVPADKPLPFLFEATNNEVRFRDERDPKPRSRPLYHVHTPKALKSWLEAKDSLRQRLQSLPALDTAGLWNCQIEAINGIEDSLKADKPRALVQMATGAGKTYTAVNLVYRLAHFARIGRVLFLVDRSNLAANAKDEFEQFVIPHDGRKFTQLYNVDVLGPAGMADATKVVVSTIQRLYAQLVGEALDEEAEEHSGFEAEASAVSQTPRLVAYNSALPIDAFDLIIIDECHRSIYNLWRQALDYFDAFLVGLTATPTKRALGFFGKNLVSEYTHERAVADQVNVGYDIYRIRTKLTERGNEIDAGTAVEIRDRLTKQTRLEVLDEQEEWAAPQLDRSVLAPNQLREVIKAFKGQCLKACFHNRSWHGERMEWVPKTLVFAKDDDHCDRIVDLVREVFAEGNAFCQKITYKLGRRESEEAIKAFRADSQFRIAVTVDMVSTGTDIRPLECLLFLRDVKSPAYYEQMKGRGTRVISREELRKVTPDAPGKSRFVLVDCVGVTEGDKTETCSLERKPSISTTQLMLQIARGDRHSDTFRTLGNRLIRLDSQLDEQQAKGLEALTGKPLKAIASELILATSDDRLLEAAKAQAGTKAPTDKQIQQAFKPKADALAQPFHKPEVRERLEQLRRSTDQLIDDEPDELLGAGYDKEKAQGLITNWQQFIADHQDELAAIKLIYEQPRQSRHLSHEQIQSLADAIGQPPYNLAPLEVWKAYEQLERSKVKGVPDKELLTNLVSLVRFSTGLADTLEPFQKLVDTRFHTWLNQHSTEFTEDQLALLHKIKDQIAQSAEMTLDDLDFTPFTQDGGLLKAQSLFGSALEPLITTLNQELIA